MTYNTIYFLIIIVFFLSLIASGRVKRVFRKYDSIPGAFGVSAHQAAAEMLSNAGSDVKVTQVSGELTDHFNPSAHTVGLSSEVYNGTSVAALAVAAHEIGHVSQYITGYSPISWRTSILPVAQLGSNAGPYIIIAGLLINSSKIAYAGLFLYAAMFLFQLITLPVEFDASRRGLYMLEQAGYIESSNMSAAKKVLRAAAMTYVLSAIGSLLSVLRFAAMIAGNTSKKRN